MDASVLNSYPAVDEAKVLELLQKKIEEDQAKIIVLDDDPTGVQTVHDVSVYTHWDLESIRQGFAEENKLFFILTNSRGFTQAETIIAHTEIADRVHQVAQELNRDYVIISRSDSTLRGHYPLETSVLRQRFEYWTGEKMDGEILCPFFKEGGRFTFDNIHYVKYGQDLIPACETEFAKDPTFGYTAYTLPEYIEEKTKGAYKKTQVTCISLDDIRQMNIEKIQKQLMEVENFEKVIVNAVDNVDVEIFCIALYGAMAAGKRFMFRSAAALVKAIGGISSRPLLSREEMVVGIKSQDGKSQEGMNEMAGEGKAQNTHGGIIVIGSHTDKTTRQLECLKELENITFVELDATLVSDDQAFEQEIKRCLAIEEACISSGKTVCCYTTRTLLKADTGNKEDELRLSVKISDAVQSLVGRLETTPAFVIAKGGITSSDIGTKALRVNKALVLGQIRPGIPVWQTEEESKFPKTPYVIFPGNVGEDVTLKEAVEILS